MHFTVLVALFVASASAANISARQGGRFITSPCTNDGGCDSGCCGFTTGKCAGAVIALQRDGGCGFGDAAPNRNAAAALGSTVQITPAAGGAAAAPAPVNNAAAAPAAAPAAGGGRFITSPCANDGGCDSGCCGFNTGKCAGAVIALQRDGGCGFGDAAPNRNAAAALGSTVQITRRTVAARQGGRFITSPCTNDGGCDSGCCGFTTGKCAGAVIALQRDGGCGFGNATPNRNAAAALGSTVQITPAAGAAPAPAAVNNAAAAPAAAAPATGSGKAAGTQFITGPCANDGECANGCCGFNTGKCAGAIVAQERDGGCGFGDAAPNDRAAQALRARSMRRRN